MFAATVNVYALGVYVCLCRHANTDQAAWPSVDTISRKINISRRQVIRALQVLETKNIIAVDRKNGRGNTYFLLDRKCWTGTGVSQSPVTSSHPAGACQSVSPVPHSHGNNTNGRKPIKNNTSTGDQTLYTSEFPEEDIARRFGLSAVKLALLIVEHGRDKIRFYATRIDNQYRDYGGIKNPGGLLVTALRNGWFEHEVPR